MTKEEARSDLNFEKAIEFVGRNGNEVEQARLKALLTGGRPPQEIVARLFAGQRPDGGWAPFWADDYSSLDATCYRLAQAEQLGLLETEAAVIRAVRFLARRQSLDGSWEEDRRFAVSAPPWAAPGDVKAKLYLTANCGLWLALSGGLDDQAGKAADYLQAHLDLDGHLPGFFHTHWLAGGLWYKLNRQETADLTFEYLRQRISDLATSNLAWLMTTLLAVGVSANHPLLEQAAALLEQGQQDDGRWSSEDGPTQDVHATLEALQALWMSGLR